MPEWLAEVIAALCWLAIRPGAGQRQRIVTWQPVLRAAMEPELVLVTDTAAEFLSAVTSCLTTRTTFRRIFRPPSTSSTTGCGAS